MNRYEHSETYQILKLDTKTTYGTSPTLSFVPLVAHGQNVGNDHFSKKKIGSKRNNVLNTAKSSILLYMRMPECLSLTLPYKVKLI